MINILKGIIEEKDYSKEVERIDAMTRKNMKVKNFMGKDSEELIYDKRYEENCIALAPHINQPVKTLSTKEYFTLLQYVDEKNKKARKK